QDHGAPALGELEVVDSDDAAAVGVHDLLVEHVAGEPEVLGRGFESLDLLPSRAQRHLAGGEGADARPGDHQLPPPGDDQACVRAGAWPNEEARLYFRASLAPVLEASARRQPEFGLNWGRGAARIRQVVGALPGFLSEGR